MKKIAIIATLAASAFTQQAYAWGDREQGILTGIAGTLILQHINQAHRQPPVVSQPPVVVQPPVVIHQPQVVTVPSPSGPVYTDRPLSCHSRPVLWDQFTGRVVQYETVCR